jgi:hypothetical protein
MNADITSVRLGPMNSTLIVAIGITVARFRGFVSAFGRRA